MTTGPFPEANRVDIVRRIRQQAPHAPMPVRAAAAAVRNVQGG
jgi:hypothetical protein